MTPNEPNWLTKIGEPTALERVNKEIYQCYKELSEFEQWKDWRLQYGCTTVELFELVVSRDNLENMPKDIHDCFSSMPEKHRDNLVQYMASKYNPLIYVGSLSNPDDYDIFAEHQKNSLINFIILLRQERDSGRYELVCDFAHSYNKHSELEIPSDVKESVQRLSKACNERTYGTFYSFASHNSDWLELTRPWVEELFTNEYESADAQP